MNAIRDRLESEGLYSQFAKTFTNWRVNFTRWNIDTLDDQSAINLIAEARPILKGVPLDEDYYQLPEDFEFAKLIQLDHDESTLFATRQIKECIAARRLYSMGFFKLLLKLKAPYRFVRDRILANRHV